MVDDFAVVMPDFILANPEFNFDLDLSKGFMYDIKVNDIRIKELKIKERVIKIVPGDKYPSIHVDFSDVNLVVHVTGGLIMGPF